MKRQLVLATLAATIALLGGCWEDDGDAVQDPVVMPNEVPDSALGLAAAYTAYVGTLASSETALPVDIGKITAAPASETALPAAI